MLGRFAMRQLTVIALSILFSCVVGCEERDTSGPTVGKGDVRHYILAQSLALGGRPVNTNNLPPLPSNWSYESNKITTYITFSREEFKAVDVFLRYVFGPPTQEPKAFADGNLVGSYDTNAAGCGIMYVMSATNSAISLFKPVVRGVDVPGFHNWIIHIGKGQYGIWGNSTHTVIVIVREWVILPLPFWAFVTLAAFGLVIIAVPWLVIRRRHAKIV
jgi:hypothetical protein